MVAPPKPEGWDKDVDNIQEAIDLLIFARDRKKKDSREELVNAAISILKVAYPHGIVGGIDANGRKFQNRV